MKSFFSGRRCLASAGLSIVVLLGALVSVPLAHAASEYLDTWDSLYPASSTDNVAGCQTCHAASTQNLNPYGRDFCLQSGTTGERILAIENDDSDTDPTGSDNITEIDANAQPGWTTAAVPTYARGNCQPTGNTETAPFSGLLDPEAPEICDNGIDDNDNGLVDCEDPQCDGFVDGATSCGIGAVSYTHLTLPTNVQQCRSRWSPDH